jgi:hypothetical protein
MCLTIMHMTSAHALPIMESVKDQLEPLELSLFAIALLERILVAAGFFIFSLLLKLKAKDSITTSRTAGSHGSQKALGGHPYSRLSASLCIVPAITFRSTTHILATKRDRTIRREASYSRERTERWKTCRCTGKSLSTPRVSPS